MMIQTSSSSRIIAVWLVLIAFLCGMMVPSLALAKKDMTIDAEGDPEDGLDYSGGGSGTLDGNAGGDTSTSFDPESDVINFVFEIYPKFPQFLIIPLSVQGYTYFEFFEDIKWKANQ